MGVRVWPIDGSGLTFGNRSTAHDVVKLLYRARHEPWGRDFLQSLPTAGVDGTLADRMRGSAAQRRCRAKTGTLTGVTALSGYCFNASGRRFAFSILMNNVTNLDRARAAQDRIAALVAGL
jgi:D-alanyl-D-alanine carboxypeptidase/D-alanyl-D-alanine-endopeptidase (penicillin-binding protein 4)